MFEIYGKENCQWCEAAKSLLERRGQDYMYWDIVKDPKALAVFKTTYPNAKTVPQISVFGHAEGYEIIGGYEDLVKYLN